eukprot:gene17401-22950_t
MDRNLLADATSGDDSPTPGYQLNEIARSTVANYQACTQIQEYLVNRISKNNPHIKFKCLVIIKHICRSGRVDFKRDMAKHIEVIKECLQYRGTPDPLRGDEYYRRVREAAKEALEAIYDSAVPVSTSAVAAANRIQGLGGGEQVISQKQTPTGILGSVTAVIQNLAVEKDLGYVGHPGATGIFTGNNPTVYSNNINTNQNTYTGPNNSNTNITTTATGMVGIGNPNFKDSREEKSWYQRASEATKQVANIAISSANSISTNKSNNSLIQTGNPSNQTDYSNTYMSNRGINAINQSEIYKPTVSIVPDIPTNPNGVGRVGSALSDGSYERLQLLSLCDPAGLKPVPNDELLSNFLSTVSTLSSDIIGNCLLDILNNDAWQSRNKGLIVLSGICSNYNNISHIDWWKNNGLDTILDISSHDSKATVRSQANKTLRVLGVNSNGSLPISPANSSHPISPSSSRNAFSSESLIETDLLGDINSSYLPPPPIPPKPPVTDTNDIFAGLSIGSGDSTNPQTYTALGLGKGSNLELADVLLTDPPYCLLERRRTNGDLRDPKPRERKLDNQPTVPRYENVRIYKDFTKKWLTSAVNCLSNEATLIIWTNALGKQPITSIANELGYKLIGEYLWAKRTTNQVKENSTKNEVLLRVYESALVFQRLELVNNIKPLTINDKCIQWSVITGYHDQDTVHPHPCHKPFPVIEPLIRQWSSPGQLVLDPFCGSGGIIKSAQRVDRRVKGIEKLDEWVSYSNKIFDSNN